MIIMSKKLSVHLVTWNGAKYIPYLFESLKNQTYKDWKLFVWDNSSSDNTVELIKKELNNFVVQSNLVENKENLGFAGGHNKLFRGCDSEYFLLLNQDMYLMPDCFEKMVKFMGENEDVAAISPRLMRWDFKGNSKGEFTDQVDSLGLKVLRNRRIIEKYTGKKWEELKSKMRMSFRTRGTAKEVFGVSGALPMFRREAMDEIKFKDGKFFDESYHSYKEDVDLAFRLQSAGFKSFVLLDATAYHDRSAAGPKDMDDKSAIKNKKEQSDWVKYHSYKNHLMTLYKNEYWQNFLLDFPWIFWYELKKFVYFLLFDRKILSGLKEVWGSRIDIRGKRYEIKSKRKVGWKEIIKWWN